MLTASRSRQPHLCNSMCLQQYVSATVCGDRTGCALATKRLENVAPEVDLGECTLHLPPQKVNKAKPTLALNPRGDITRNPKQGYQWPQKRTCVSAKKRFKKPKNNAYRIVKHCTVNLRSEVFLSPKYKRIYF